MSRLAWLSQLVTPWIYLLWPGVILHEFTHYVVASFFGEVEIDWSGTAKAAITFDEDVPLWAVWLTFYAPWVVGGLTAPLALSTLSGFEGPLFALALWLRVNWLLYFGLSVGDLFTPMGFTDARLEA